MINIIHNNKYKKISYNAPLISNSINKKNYFIVNIPLEFIQAFITFLIFFWLWATFSAHALGFLKPAFLILFIGVE